LTLEIRLIAGDGGNNEDGPIKLALSSATPKPFPGTQQGNQPQGWVALDFGNTNTTLAFLTAQTDERRAIDRTLQRIQLLDASQHPAPARANPEPVESCLALKKYGIGGDPASLHYASWIIGERSRAGSDGLVLGLKRLVASAKWQTLMPIRVSDGNGKLRQQE